MPKIHIIYDPTEKLKTTELPHEIKTAVMFVHNETKEEDLKEIYLKLVEMLVDQIEWT